MSATVVGTHRFARLAADQLAEAERGCEHDEVLPDLVGAHSPCAGAASTCPGARARRGVTGKLGAQAGARAVLKTPRARVCKKRPAILEALAAAVSRRHLYRAAHTNQKKNGVNRCPLHICAAAGRDWRCATDRRGIGKLSHADASGLIRHGAWARLSRVAHALSTEVNTPLSA